MTKELMARIHHDEQEHNQYKNPTKQYNNMIEHYNNTTKCSRDEIVSGKTL